MVLLFTNLFVCPKQILRTMANSSFSNVTLPAMDPIVCLTLQPFVLCMASYLLVVQWAYFCRRYGCTKTNREPGRPEATLLGVASVLTESVVLLQSVYCLKSWQALSPLMSFEIVNVVAMFVSTVLLTLTYTVTWLRQRHIYNNPALHHLSNTTSRFVSKYFIILIPVLHIISWLVAFMLPLSDYCAWNCQHLLLIPLTFTPLTIHAVLLGLLLIPLVKHHLTNEVTDHKYVDLIRRMVVLTLVTVVSDSVSAILFTYVPNGSLYVGVNMIVNVTCVTLILVDWTERIIPWWASGSGLKRKLFGDAKRNSAPAENFTNGAYDEDSLPKTSPSPSS